MCIFFEASITTSGPENLISVCIREIPFGEYPIKEFNANKEVSTPDAGKAIATLKRVLPDVDCDDDSDSD